MVSKLNQSHITCSVLEVILTVIIPRRQESVIVGCRNDSQVDKRVPSIGIDLTDLVGVGTGIPARIRESAADKSEGTYQTALSSSSLEWK